MKLRAFAILAALTAPGLASATPADTPPTHTPTSNAPTNNSPNNQPANPTPDKSPPGSTSSDDTSKKGDKAAKLSDGDIRTIAHLHHVNQMEITLAKDAQRQGTKAVKDYAATLITDHTAADKDLTAFAKAHQLTTIPADKPTTDADRQDDKDMTQQMAHLKTLKGADFDKEFLSMMVEGHEKTLAKLDTAMGMVTSDELKTAIQNVKPTVQKHADQARDLQKAAPQAMK